MEHRPRLSVQIVTNNAKETIAECLRCLQQQSYKDFSVLIIDNNSSDGTSSFLRENYPKVLLLQNVKNLGLGKAHNQGLKLINSEYVLFLGQNILLASDAIEKLVSAMEKNPQMGSCGGKLLIHSERLANEFSQEDILESTGLVMKQDRSIAIRGYCEKDSGQYDTLCEVFGFGGSFVMYRRTALEGVKISIEAFHIDEYFDEEYSFFVSDIDIAWRSQLFGYKSIFIPSAVGHAMYATTEELPITMKKWNPQKSKNPLNSLLYYPSQVATIFKNESTHDLLLPLPAVAFHQFKDFSKALILRRSRFLSEIFRFGNVLPKLRAKRTFIQQKKKVNIEDIITSLYGAEKEKEMERGRV